MRDLKIFTDIVEQEAIDQIDHLLEQPAFQNCKVRIMPDVHSGKGCVIGFTADLGDKVIPNIVGVDIGCGMLTVKLDADAIDFDRLDAVIREFVPNGRDIHAEQQTDFTDLQNLCCFPHLNDTGRILCSIGTLGSGNHFIEVDRGQDGGLYLVIHTGSRNLGKQVAEYYQDLAYRLAAYNEEEYDAKRKALIAEYKKLGRVRELPDALKKLKADAAEKAASVDRNLCYLEGEYRQRYLHDMKICQDYAKLNRKLIADTILKKMGISEVSRFETVHNYINHDSNIVRKGAISAKKNELLLIPISMKDGCILGRGKGNEDWNCSAPHGAGRHKSRSEAKKKLKVAEFAREKARIYTTSVSEETLDEAPMAYKSLGSIVDNIADTVEIIEILKPVYNFKAN